MSSVRNTESTVTYRIFMKAAKMPIIYLLIGAGLLAISHIDDILGITAWKNWFDLTDKAGVVFLVLSALSFLYKSLVLLCRRGERRLMPNHLVASLVMCNIRKSLRIIFTLIFINANITILSPNGFYAVLANQIINTILIGSVGWIVIQLFYTLETALYQHMMQLTRQEHARAKAFYTKIHILRNIATVVIVILTIAAILMSFSSFRNIGISLLASAGFLTAIIGLSAQKALFSLFSGVQIALSQPIKIGDIVVIENVTGIIEEITFTYVTLKLGDRRRMLLPINFFIDKPFENWSKESDSLVTSLHFHVDYSMPINELRTEFDRILTESTLWDGAANKLQVANLLENTVEVRLQISAENAENLADLRAEIREKILHFIQNNHAQTLPKLSYNRRCELSSESP